MRFRRFLFLFGLLLLIAITLFHISRARDFQLFGQIISHGGPDRPAVALTFDDGPSNRYTQPVLDILRAHNVHATFFVTGREAAEKPEAMQAIVAAGHEVGNHSWSHQRMVLMSPRRVAEELGKTDTAIRNAGYSGPIHFRPPYGKKLVSLPLVLSRQGRPTIMWSMEPETPDQTPEELAQTIIDQARPGDIILLHVMFSTRATTRAALPNIIKGLRDKGLEPVRLSDLF